jgi:ATP-dependent Clp endopeptidase proteolytic subunit ClpP
MIKILARADGRAEILIHEAIGENWYGDGLTSKRFVEDLKALGNVSEILVRINSPGGAVFDGVAIYNTLKNHGAKVEVLVEGLAASIASVIAMAGSSIKMGEGAMMMVHNPWTFAMGDANDMRTVADSLDQIAESMIDIYVSRTGLARDEVKAMLDAETWLTASSAIDKGFADSLPDEDDQDEEAKAANTAGALAKNVADFAAFRARFQRASAQVSPSRIAAMVIPPASADITQEISMTIKADTTASASAGADVNAAVQTALAAEQTRRAQIKARFGKFSAAHRELLDECLDDPSVTADAAGQKLLAKLGEAAQPLAAAAEITVDARDKFLVGAEKAILARAGLEKADRGNEFNGLSLTDLAARAITLKGGSVRGMSKDQIARKVLASHTSSDFPLLLANTAGKQLRAAYALAPVTWNRWCKTGSVSDFKAASRHTLGSFSSLLTKPEAGEYKQGTVGEEREPITALTKGRYISLSREMLVNDDLGGFVGMAQKMGRAAARTVEADVYALLTSASGAGPTMSDTGAFFNATAVTTAGGHANLTSSGTAISVASIALGEAAMLAQRDKSLNDYLALAPRFLLTSVSKKQIAWETVNSLTDVASSNSAKKNYVQAQMNLEVVATPYLTSANPWYLFTDPADVEAFEVAFLDGVQEPFIDEEINFMSDAMNMKVRLDYGVAAIDWRAGYRNAGA